AGLLLPNARTRLFPPRHGQPPDGERGRSTLESPSVTNQLRRSRTRSVPDAPPFGLRPSPAKPAPPAAPLQKRKRNPLERRTNPRRRSMPVETGFAWRQYTAATREARKTS